jgi:hypothetical protein
MISAHRRNCHIVAFLLDLDYQGCYQKEPFVSPQFIIPPKSGWFIAKFFNGSAMNRPFLD